MPTSFIGLFLFSTALSLVATFSVLAVLGVVRAVRRRWITGSQGARNSIPH